MGADVKPPSSSVWEHRRFAELCLEKAQGPGISGKLYDRNGNVAILRTTDISADGRIDLSHMARARIDLDRLQSHILKAGDLVITRSGRVGTAALFNGFEIPVIPAGYSTRFRLNESADPRFYRYFFNSSSGQHALKSRAVGSVQQNLAGTAILDMDVPVPPLPEQRAIARVLGSLDDKIELNRRMNQTLEEICRALFKFWFVDFGPVRAKAEGRWKKGESLPGMPADMWDLWPREFEESEIGGIPKGWAVRGLLEIATLHSGGTPTTSERSYWGGGIPWVSGKDVSSAKGSFLLRTERTVSDKGIAHSHTSPLPARTVVITARGTVGALAILAMPMCISQTNYGLKAANGAPDSFLRFAVEGAVEGLQQESYGTIFDTITTKNLSATQVVLPAPPVLAAFADRTDPLMNGVLMNLRLIETLTEARDTLLPKLLSGEIRVKVDS